MQSLIHKYSNGYQAHFIDKHPNKDFFRRKGPVFGDYDIAFDDETIVVLKDGVVCMFLHNEDELCELEVKMNLIRVN